MKKKIAIITLVIAIIIPLFIIINPTIKNNNYYHNLSKKISKETGIKDILYVNNDNNYYIVKTNEKVIVFDLNFEEVYSITTNEIVSSSLELTYRQNNLYYKEKIRQDKKLTYNFYDGKTNELVYKASVGGTHEWNRTSVERKANNITTLLI